MTRDFTATTFIVKDGKVLLHKHKKLGFWLPPGGHIDPNELPEEAAVREIKEETGFEVELIDMDEKKWESTRERLLIKPAHILLEKIKEDHEHIDLIYFAKYISGEFQERNGESREWGWFDLEGLKRIEYPENVPFLVEEAIDYFKAKKD